MIFMSYAQSSAHVTQPNIVLVLSDDQDETSLQFMPHTQALFDQSMVYENFFASTPVCCPARAQIQRGQYGHTTGMHRNNPPLGGYETFSARNLDHDALPTWFQQAGYRTALIGKYMNGFDSTHPPKGWDELIVTQSKDYWDYTLYENGQQVHYPKQNKNYLTNVLHGKAVDFVEKAQEDTVPYLLILAHRAPHGDYQIHPDYRDIRVPFTPGPAFNHYDPGKKFHTIQDLTSVVKQNQQRVRMLQSLDQSVNKLNNLVNDHTYFLYTTDNAYMLGEHGLLKKGYLYDASMRFPLSIRGPGIAPGTNTHPYALIDLAPTFADWADITHHPTSQMAWSLAHHEPIFLVKPGDQKARQY